MSQKIGGQSISYKNGKLIIREASTSKYNLSLDNLPPLLADKVEEVVRRIYAIKYHTNIPELGAAFVDEDLPYVTRMAEAVLIEAGLFN